MTHANETNGPLAGVRVVDLSRVLAGPIAGQALADHGAEVIKIEPPAGDETRGWGPPFCDDNAPYFLGLNRNKRAISLDLTAEEGREVLLALLEDADVLIENFKSGTMEKWHLGYEEVLRARFPRLVYATVSGFGADGPLGGLPGYDAILQAMGGIMSVNGPAGGEPTRVGLPVVDVATGMNVVIGVLLALIARQSTGQGQAVEATLFDTALFLLHPHAPNFLLAQSEPKLTGNDHPTISPYSTYRTKTRDIYLAVGNNRQFKLLCGELGIPNAADDPRFLDNGSRVTNREALRETLENAMTSHDGDALAKVLIKVGVPAGPILTTEEALNHEHTVHRGSVISSGGYSGVRSPVRLSDMETSLRYPPPSFDEHREEILSELDEKTRANGSV
ncbi:MAG: CaiB/BaiF CoA transferase family protein [Paracoccaceae bacterium]